jgi:integrase
VRTLNYQLKQLCMRNHDGSFATRADRERILSLAANQLAELGFVGMSAHSLRTKHVEALLNRWKQEGIKTGSIKNRMSALRWWAEKVNKQNVIKRSNADYEIPNRVLVTNVSKAIELDSKQLDRISDPYTRASIALQAAFGLRREESIKIIPARADGGNVLKLKATWTKGGRARDIPFTTPEQRAAIDYAKTVAGQGSLIPESFRYKDQLERFRSQCQAANIVHGHGLRHLYAMARYLALTGWKCPADGGPKSAQLTRHQKNLDRQARMTISQEMGHEREQITSVYCGR